MEDLHTSPAKSNPSREALPQLLRVCVLLGQASLLIEREKGECFGATQTQVLTTISRTIRLLIAPLQRLARSRCPGREAVRIRPDLAYCDKPSEVASRG
jgi:hypothetical protein